MSDKTKKPIQDPPQPAPSSSATSAGATAFGSNQWLLEQLRMQQEEAQESSRPPLAAGMWQELGYRIPQNFPGSAAGATDNYNLSFRDKSGYRGSTSEAFLNKARSGSKWKGLRMDYGPNVKTGGQTNWHWNQKGSMNAFGKADHALASPGAARLGQTLRALKPLSRGAMVVGAGMDAYDLGTEAHQSMQTGDWSNTAAKGTEIAGGWAGAYAGAKSMGAAGAGIGTFLGGPVGTMVGGALGGIIGGIGGYMAGSKFGQWLGSGW